MIDIETAKPPGVVCRVLFASVRAVIYAHKVYWLLLRCMPSRRLPRMIVTKSSWEAGFWLMNMPYRLVAKIESRRGDVKQCKWELVWHDSTLTYLCSPKRSWQYGCLVGVPNVMMNAIHEPLAINAAGNSNGVDSPTITEQLRNPIAVIVMHFCNLGKLGKGGGVCHGVGEGLLLKANVSDQATASARRC